MQLHPIILRFFKFGMVGVSALAIESLIIFTLNYAGIPAKTSRLISLPIAILYTWYLNRNFTFNNKDRNKIKQLSIYYFYMLCGFVINYSVYLFILRVLGEETIFVLIAISFGSLSSMTFNFLTSNFLIFKEK